MPAGVNLAWRDDDLEQAAAALVGGEVRPAYELLRSTHDPDRRDLRADVLGDVGKELHETISAFADERERDSSAQLLKGSALRSAAWAVRRRAVAKRASDEDRGRLFFLAACAMDALATAGRLAPDDGVPWSQHISAIHVVAREVSNVDDFHRRMAERSPDLYAGTVSWLSAQSGRWHGSTDRLVAFARERTSALPDGHPLLALIPHGRLEGWLDTMLKANIVVRIRDFYRNGYFKRPAVKSEVDTASDRILSGDGAFREHPWAMTAHQTFAAYYAHASDSVRLRSHLELSGPRAALQPWSFFGDPTKEFAEARRAAGLQ
ncbi:hypothetical protein [Actinocrispum sp. NPDC049592]|uniref:hypothetical protein n=1 Tax=Actinocrispum sp. NPDC049592 TaxID=3154835 RepID=UPI0034299229